MTSTGSLLRSAFGSFVFCFSACVCMRANEQALHVHTKLGIIVCISLMQVSNGRVCAFVREIVGETEKRTDINREGEREGEEKREEEGGRHAGRGAGGGQLFSGIQS